MSSKVTQIFEERVAVEIDDAVRELPNDYVLVFAGGVLPTPFLEAAGVQVQTLKGEVYAPAKLTRAVTCTMPLCISGGANTRPTGRFSPLPEANALAEHHRKQGQTELVDQPRLEALTHHIAAVEVHVLAVCRCLRLGHQLIDGTLHSPRGATLGRRR